MSEWGCVLIKFFMDNGILTSYTFLMTQNIILVLIVFDNLKYKNSTKFIGYTNTGSGLDLIHWSGMQILL